MLGLFTGFSFLSAVEIFYIFIFKNIWQKSSTVEPAIENSSPKYLNTLKVYLNESSIHSFNYIGTERSRIDKYAFFSFLYI
jgi:hypothetical protein